MGGIKFAFTQWWANYHPGGEYELRTADPSKYGGSGQQCIYDKQGKLMTKIPAAGTADKSSPNAPNNTHIRDDVEPYDLARELGRIYVERYYEVRPSM